MTVSLHSSERLRGMVYRIVVRVPVRGGLLVTFCGRRGALEVTNRTYAKDNPIWFGHRIEETDPFIPRPWLGRARRFAEAVVAQESRPTHAQPKREGYDPPLCQHCGYHDPTSPRADICPGCGEQWCDDAV